MACAMTKSPPVALGKEALAVAQEALPAHASPYSPKIFTQHQLFEEDPFRRRAEWRLVEADRRGGPASREGAMAGSYRLPRRRPDRHADFHAGNDSGCE